MIWTNKLGRFERGFLWRDGELLEVLSGGATHYAPVITLKRLDIVNVRDIFLTHPDLNVIIKSGKLNTDETMILNLSDKQRALLWVDNRFSTILGPGDYVLWTVFNDIKVEVVDIDSVVFNNENLDTIMQCTAARDFLDEHIVEDGFVGLFFKNGAFVSELAPGRYAFWKRAAKVKLYNKDVRIQAADISGQEIMTSDKVTLRINALVNYKIVDALKAVTMSDDTNQALYREAQLTLRKFIGTCELDEVLADKTAIIEKLESKLSAKMAAFGLEIVSFGIRDIILPGDMKELMNRVTEAQKVAEANLITRRDEVAATRSQINIANMLENNATLMRLRELEVIEKLAGNSNLSVFLGDKGLERVFNLI